MNARFPHPVRYSHGQFLGVEDFVDEQNYHIAALRRHNIGPHAWGIVNGLEVECQKEEAPSQSILVIVQPGYCVDAYGRELVLTRSSVVKVDPALHRGQGIDRLEVCITYRRQPAQAPLAPGVSVQSQSVQPLGRWDETPEILIRPARGARTNATGKQDDANSMGGQSPETILTDAAIDSGEAMAPVLLAQLMIPGDLQNDMTVDMGGRRYVGITASEISSPTGDARIVLGADGNASGSLFTIFAKDNSDETETAVVEVDGAGHLDLRANVTVGGALALSGGSMEFSAPDTHASTADLGPAEKWRMYRAVGVDGVEELRIEMPMSANANPGETGSVDKKALPSEVAIGAWSETDKTFKAGLTVVADGTVHISGDLVVKGLINPHDPGDQSQELKELTERVELGALTTSLAQKNAEDKAQKQQKSIAKWIIAMATKMFGLLGLKKPSP